MPSFDPYHKWLGISPKDQPPNHYRLLGIDLFESDPDVVDAAVEQRVSFVRQCATGQYLTESQKLLNEIAAARLCLVNAKKRAAYDAELAVKLAPIVGQPPTSPMEGNVHASSQERLTPESQPIRHEPQDESEKKSNLAGNELIVRRHLPRKSIVFAAIAIVLSLCGIAMRSTRATIMQVLIPAGEFEMGSPKTEIGRTAREGPQHKVRITKPFYMGVHEVTQGEYEPVMGTNPTALSKNGVYSSRVSRKDTNKLPVEVSWFDAIEFCNKLSEKNGLPAYYTLGDVKRQGAAITEASVSVAGGKGFRLPTEAEWEYACRAGTTTPFNFGSTSNGRESNVNGRLPYGTDTYGPNLGRTTTVGSYQANAFGLFDMHGNAKEWCFDIYDEKCYASRSGTRLDPLVTMNTHDIYSIRNPSRVNRGGDWNEDPKHCRAAARRAQYPGTQNAGIGFRVARD